MVSPISCAADQDTGDSQFITYQLESSGVRLTHRVNSGIQRTYGLPLVV